MSLASAGLIKKMQKEFLDKLYQIRHALSNGIDRITDDLKRPQSGCKHCESTSGDVKRVELQAKKDQKFMVDDIISSYLTLK